MEKFKSIDSLRLFLDAQRLQGLQIGLVPTMGALHEGHFELIKRSKSDNDITIASIFINPTQFNNSEDLVKYPRTIEKDFDSLDRLGCQAVFIPDEKEIYPTENMISFNPGYFDSVMEGAFRPDHFSGVALIVSKLFNIIEPNRAYFGQKDLQQLILIKHLVQDLNFNIEIVGVPTHREASGLAMSSRNQRLSVVEKASAAQIYQGLCLIMELLKREKQIDEAKEAGIQFYSEAEGFELEYLEIVESSNLTPLASTPPIDTNVAVCVAGYVGSVRLLDNICFKLTDPKP